MIGPMQTDIAVIGGSGLYRMEGAKVIEDIDIPTPFGMPSDAISVVEVAGKPVAFLPRHGIGHRLLPTEVPSRANIWALKSLGVRQIISVSAVGSLMTAYKPGDFVLCDQLIDRTSRRDSTFFGSGLVGHVAFAEPFCPTLLRELNQTFLAAGRRHHASGTLVVMEGPVFSTRAESELHRRWEASCIGMTALPEARLAREAEICYAVVATVTDYDCWHKTEEAVTMETVLKVMAENTHAIQAAIPEVVRRASAIEDCTCRHAAAGVFTTPSGMIPYETRRRLKLLYGRYWG
jgi:5'-methylthioadenosine phosphorylase